MYKLYVVDDNGGLVFEFTAEAGGLTLPAPTETKVKTTQLVKAALHFLSNNRRGNGKNRRTIK